MALRNPLACPPPRTGDAAVHLDFGLCRVGQLESTQLSDTTLRTILLHFKGGEVRRVPVSDAVRIWNYGAYLPDNRLDPLDNEAWVQRQVEVVTELRASMKVLGDRRDARLRREGFDVKISAAQLKKAGKGFGFELTDDQTQALSEIVADLKTPAPMNRLLIGDVGCGKTEVAVRALLATALAGGRGRLIAPTRVLARQHHDDIKARAEALGLRVALYSGDLTDGEKDKVVEAAEEADLLVGTLALLGERFERVDFDLTVIDEEQKFGAKVKRSGYDAAIEGFDGGNALRLSATPIPATIAEARVGLSDLSIIRQYPKGRAPTHTRTAPQENKAFRDALEFEFARGGQVIVMAPRIRDLETVQPLMETMFPERRFGLVHGKLRGEENRETLEALLDGELDGVLATTVLETGVNLPRANTMVVLRPEQFGLAQLHQLRGRIGRGSVEGHFIMLTREDSNADFLRRLDVLESLHRRGDGLALALADTMLRGSGDMDGGDEQTGHASTVGLELYDYLLRAGAGANPFRLVPKISGQLDWGLPEDDAEALDAAFAGTRAALEGQPCSDLLCEVVANSREYGADKATVGPKGVLMERGGDAFAQWSSVDAMIEGVEPTVPIKEVSEPRRPKRFRSAGAEARKRVFDLGAAGDYGAGDHGTHSTMTFKSLGLAPDLLRALDALGYETPTPIQREAIPFVLDGRDLLGIAQTGTGKTASFALPTLDRITNTPKDPPKRGARVLVLAPTRELVAQIADSFTDYGRNFGKLRVARIVGGVGMGPQVKKLVPGNDVVVATPGRLIDLLERKDIRLGEVEVLILDEADQMLDMGFIHALRKIIPHLPDDRQTLLFSATFPKDIQKLARDFLRKPARVEVTPPNKTADKVEQSAFFIDKSDKPLRLAEHLLRDEVGRALVFTRTKHGADRLVRKLARYGIPAIAIHGNKGQGARRRALDAFKDGTVKTLVATDVAARGIDIPDVTHVFNYEIPNVPEQYVHRIGRTARAERSGEAVAFVSDDERDYLRDIRRLLGGDLPLGEEPDDLEARLDAVEARDKIPLVRLSPDQPQRSGRGKNRRKKNKDKKGGGGRGSGSKDAESKKASSGADDKDADGKPKRRRSRRRRRGRGGKGRGNGATSTSAGEGSKTQRSNPAASSAPKSKAAGGAPKVAKHARNGSSVRRKAPPRR